MDTNDLLGIEATFSRVALALDREGVTSHSVERIMGWATLTFGRTLTRVPEPIQVPWCSVSVRDFLQYDARGATPGSDIAPVLADVCRTVAESAKANRLGYTDDRVNGSWDIAVDPASYSVEILTGARDILRACVQHHPNEQVRAESKRNLDTITANLEVRT